MDNLAIVDKVKEAVTSILKEHQIELVDITYRREKGQKVLRILVDKSGGITLDECGWLNSRVGWMLDGSNIIAERYILEVSSPGVDRPLKTPQDFARAAGKLVKIITSVPIKGENLYIGRLKGVNSEKVIVETEEGKSFVISLDKITKARLEIRW